LVERFDALGEPSLLVPVTGERDDWKIWPFRHYRSGTQRALIQSSETESEALSMGLLLLIVLLVFLLGGLPNWGYHSYGFAPSGLAGVLLIIVVVLLLTGRL
jgi:hypothetical protein